MKTRKKNMNKCQRKINKGMKNKKKNMMKQGNLLQEQNLILNKVIKNKMYQQERIKNLQNNSDFIKYSFILN